MDVRVSIDSVLVCAFWHFFFPVAETAHLQGYSFEPFNQALKPCWWARYRTWKERLDRKAFVTRRVKVALPFHCCKSPLINGPPWRISVFNRAPCGDKSALHYRVGELWMNVNGVCTCVCVCALARSLLDLLRPRLGVFWSRTFLAVQIFTQYDWLRGLKSSKRPRIGAHYTSPGREARGRHGDGRRYRTTGTILNNSEIVFSFYTSDCSICRERLL